MTRQKILFMLTLIFIILLSAAAPLPAAEETLTIYGDGVERETVFSRAELEKLRDVMESHTYSLTNNYPTDKVEYASGIPLLYLLQKAGLKDSAQMIICTASDGYQRGFTVQELLRDKRWYFPDSGEKRLAPAMVCLQYSEKSPGERKDGELKLAMGQRARGEQNNPWWVKYLARIEVTSAKPARWPEVAFERVDGKDGGSGEATLYLSHEYGDAVKIYYTTDGSTPTVDSRVYNLSASYFQPQLNKPLAVTKNTTVRAIAIGAGREDSPVSSISISFDKAMFNDLAGYEWAAGPIGELAGKGIVAGVGDGRFDPAADLTRGMFVTMLGRVFGSPASSPPPAGALRFPDVDYSEWYSVYLQWAVSQSVAGGYPDGTFKPMNPLTIEEMIAMTVRAGKLELRESSAGGTTVVGASEWASQVILIAESHGLLAPGRLSHKTAEGIAVTGRDRASRAQAAVLLYSLLNVL